MTRETYMTKKDKVFMKLGKEIQAKIKTPKEWREFKRYCDFYYCKLPNIPSSRVQNCNKCQTNLKGRFWIQIRNSILCRSCFDKLKAV